MKSKTWGLVLFALGIFFMYAFNMVNFWLMLVRIAPLMTLFRILPINAVLMLMGYTPPIGAALMVIGGLVYGKKAKEAIK